MNGLLSQTVGKTDAVKRLMTAYGRVDVNPWSESVGEALNDIFTISGAQNNADVGFVQAAQSGGKEQLLFEATTREMLPPEHLNVKPDSFPTAGGHIAFSPALRSLSLSRGVFWNFAESPLIYSEEARALVADYSSRYSRLINYYDADLDTALEDAVEIDGTAIVLADDIRPLNFCHWLVDWLPRLASLGPETRRSDCFVLSTPLTARFQLESLETRTADDRFLLDATATDDQAPGPVNFLMNPDVPGMALGLFFLGGDPSQVCNAGGPRSLDEVRLREGSLLWPRFPAPLGMRGLTMMRLLAALNGLVNEGTGGAPASHAAYVIIMFRGKAGGQPFLLSDGVGVGYGARPDADGIDAVYFVAQENYPVEFLEAGYPMRVLSYGINRDSGGAGRLRGGCGVVREYEFLGEEAILSMRIDSVDNPTWGVAGGGSGRAGRAVVNPGRPDERVLRPLSDGNLLRHGDILRLETGGGGGHGSPHGRPATQVLADVLDGFVSTEEARAAYGVVIRDGRVDEAATGALRRQPEQERPLVAVA